MNTIRTLIIDISCQIYHILFYTWGLSKTICPNIRHQYMTIRYPIIKIIIKNITNLIILSKVLLNILYDILPFIVS